MISKLINRTEANMETYLKSSAKVQVVQVAVSGGATVGSMDALNAFPPIISTSVLQSQTYLVFSEGATDLLFDVNVAKVLHQNSQADRGALRRAASRKSGGEHVSGKGRQKEGEMVGAGARSWCRCEGRRDR